MQIACGGIFAHAGDATAHVANAMLFARGGEVSVILLVEGALVHDEDAALHILAQTLLGEDGFLGGIHAADRRAEGVGLIARADALEPGDRVGRPLIRSADHDPLGRAGAARQALVLHRVQDVGVTSITEFG